MPVVKLECRSIRKVEVPGLGDFYFKQVREFEDTSDFSSLQKFLDSGAIRIVAGSITTTQKDVEVNLPSRNPPKTEEPVVPQKPKPSPKPKPKPRPKQEIVQEPEPQIIVAPKPEVDSRPVEQIISDLSDKLASEVVRKVSSGLTFEGAGVVKKPEAFKMPAGDLYIPSIKVTDMTSNISLDSRVVGTGGKVNESLGKLKALRGNKNG